MPDAPRPTFVFTGIERSTALLERLGGASGDVLATHAELVLMAEGAAMTLGAAIEFAVGALERIRTDDVRSPTPTQSTRPSESDGTDA